MDRVSVPLGGRGVRTPLVLRGHPRGRGLPPKRVCGIEVGAVGFIAPSSMWVGGLHEIWGDPCFTEESPEGRRDAPCMSVWGWRNGAAVTSWHGGDTGWCPPQVWGLEGVLAPWGYRWCIEGWGGLLLPHRHGAGRGPGGTEPLFQTGAGGGGTPHG